MLICSKRLEIFPTRRPIRPSTVPTRPISTRPAPSNPNPRGILTLNRSALLALTVSALLARAGDAQTAARAWGDVAIGYGSFGCEECDRRSAGVSGEAAIGRTLSQHWRYGLGGTAWMGDVTTTEGDGSTTSGGQMAFTLTPMVQVNPLANTGIFLRAALGFGLAGEPGSLGRVNTGLSTGFGAGYEFAAGSSRFMVFAGRADLRSDRNNVEVIQLHFGITLPGQRE